MKKLALITLVTLATVCFTQAQGILTLPGDEPHVPPPGWTGAWPPMPTVVASYPPPNCPPPCYPVFVAPPEFVLPNYGVSFTTVGLTPTSVPEPSTVALFAISIVAVFFLRRRVRVDVAA